MPNEQLTVWEVCKVTYDDLGQIFKVQVTKDYPLLECFPLNSDPDYEHHLWEQLKTLRNTEDYEQYDLFLQYLIGRYIHLRQELG